MTLQNRNCDLRRRRRRTATNTRAIWSKVLPDVTVQILAKTSRKRSLKIIVFPTLKSSRKWFRVRQFHLLHQEDVAPALPVSPRLLNFKVAGSTPPPFVPRHRHISASTSTTAPTSTGITNTTTTSNSSNSLEHRHMGKKNLFFTKQFISFS